MATTSKQVLVISRTSVSRMRLGIIFKRLGFEPLISETTNEGIELARNNSPSLIFFDTDLPKKELQSVLMVLKSETSTKDLPLIVTTSQRNAPDQDSLLALGCTEVVTMPVDVTQVFQMLGNVFGLMRKSLRVPALIVVAVVKERYERTLDCTNISETGMFLRTDEPIPEKTFVNVNFVFPLRDQEFDLKAIVERTVSPDENEKEPGMGIKFLDISETDRQEIRRFIQQSTLGTFTWEQNAKAFDHVLNKTGRMKKGGQ